MAGLQGFYRVRFHIIQYQSVIKNIGHKGHKHLAAAPLVLFLTFYVVLN